MFNNILEISKRANKNGRVATKIILLKIHSDPEETNKNGIHWNKEYVQNAIESVSGMPLCCEFIDDEKSIPLGHGLTGHIINSDGIKEPVFENSEVVGMFERGAIEIVKDANGNEIEALCGYGYFYIQRYPNLVKWVRENFAIGQVMTSIEIMGTQSNDNKIVYEGEVTDEYRVPKEFLFSGCAVLSVSPSDDNAVILEISQKKENKEEKPKMEFNMNEIKETIQSVISECNDKSADYETKISELNSQIETKDAELATKDSTISELNASVEDLRKTLKQMEEDRDTYWAERAILEQELAKAKVAEKLAELDDSLAEFNSEEKEVAKDDIEKLKENINACKKTEELNEVTSEINSIKSKICMSIVANQKKAESEARIAEQNSFKEAKVEDIFSEICAETNTDENLEDVNIF